MSAWKVYPCNGSQGRPEHSLYSAGIDGPSGMGGCRYNHDAPRLKTWPSTGDLARDGRMKGCGWADNLGNASSHPAFTAVLQFKITTRSCTCRRSERRPPQARSHVKDPAAGLRSVLRGSQDASMKAGGAQHSKHPPGPLRGRDRRVWGDITFYHAGVADLDAFSFEMMRSIQCLVSYGTVKIFHGPISEPFMRLNPPSLAPSQCRQMPLPKGHDLL